MHKMNNCVNPICHQHPFINLQMKNKHKQKQDSHTLYKHWLGTQSFWRMFWKPFCAISFLPHSGLIIWIKSFFRCNLFLNTHLSNFLYIDPINYYMAFFISYTLSVLGHDISPRVDRLKGLYMNEGWTMVWYE